MKPTLRNLKDFTSEILFLTGLSKCLTNEEIAILLTDSCTEIDFQFRQQYGKLYARFPSVQAASLVKHQLHQSIHYEIKINCRFELGVDDKGKRIVSLGSHNTIIRKIKLRKGSKKCQLHQSEGKGYYSYKSVIVGEVEYPFPSGLYMSRFIQTIQRWPRDDPLIRLLTDVQSFGGKYSKEISEVMAMVDAVDRGVKMTCGGRPCQSLEGPVRVFVLGDGKRPYGAAALALHYSYLNWTFVSIDPLLSGMEEVGSHQIVQFVGKSQDYEIVSSSTNQHPTTGLDIVVCCHSHAPLQEFWDRLIKGSRLAVVLPCCAEFNNLVETSLFEFDDYEIYSPKRTVRIYFDEDDQNQTQNLKQEEKL